MNNCQQCGAPTAGQLCDQCGLWFGPAPAQPDERQHRTQLRRDSSFGPPATLEDPYRDLPEPPPLHAEAPERPRAVPLTIGLSILALGLAAALALVVLGGGLGPKAAVPAASPIASMKPSASPTPTAELLLDPSPSPTPEPVTVVTVTQLADTPDVDEPLAEDEPSVDETPQQSFERFYPLERGSTGYVVGALQALLSYQGVRTYVDSDFGPATERSVRQWQAQQGLAVTGIVDDTTWESLTPKLALGDSGDAVTVLQDLLVARGYPVVVDGEFGTETRESVMTFQSDRGLAVDGLVGLETWPALLA